MFLGGGDTSTAQVTAIDILPYSGKFFAGAKFRGNAFRLSRKIFIFVERMHNTLTTPYQLMAMPHERTEETALNDKAKKQACATMA